ncbi:N-6 DNA methylase [uncultured Leptotrichia sp.]|uniref:N-6 DNA methylase n=1 Tax=uncultured Leptotrichia sp. TaxID=159271 RepID=UPI00342C7267
MSFEEHNNRKIAKKLAEYITGTELRQYTARKVKKYIKIDNPAIFDGAVGSGQLEQFIEPSKLYGIDIQEQSVLTTRRNYENTDIEIGSFFNYIRGDFVTNAVVMNPPFSIEFKSLSDEEKENIQKEFDWKKSGKVDDIFVLKSLKYTKRFGFYILFPGVCYRKTEQKFRELIGNNLTELNLIRNAFDDTSIEVIFIIIDKEKTSRELEQEIYDCKLKKQIHHEISEIPENFRWETPHEVIEKEEIDILLLENEIERVEFEKFKNGLKQDLFLIVNLGVDINIENKIKKRKKFLNDFEKEVKEALCTGKVKYTIEELKLF